MRVLVAPDSFTGTLSAPEAARAIAEGWRRTAPDDELDVCPMADGGPGFVDVLHEVLGGELLAVTVPSPAGEPVPAAVLRVGQVAYLESAAAIGHGVVPGGADPLRATSAGVGVLLARAVETGARRVVVGVGGAATHDGGAGLLAALGARAPEADLGAGPVGLGELGAEEPIDLGPARELLGGTELVVATDVDTPLLGIVGATKTFGPQNGLTDDQLLTVDRWLQRFAERTDRKLADVKGAGAGGGVGFGLMLLGATRQPAVDLVAEAVGLAERARAADLVLTGEGAFDFSSRSGKVPYGVAAVAADVLRPCVALAGRVFIGSREMRALGIESAYSVVDLVGENRALADPASGLAALAERIARTWSF